MQKTKKWLLIIISGLVVVALFILFLAPKLLDLDQVRAFIEHEVAEAAGRPIEIKGDLRLSLFPWAAIESDDIRLGNVPGFGEKYMVRVNSCEARVKFMPLVFSLFKDIHVKRFVLDGVQVFLETNKKGQVN